MPRSIRSAARFLTVRTCARSGVSSADLEHAVATARGWIDAALRIVVLTGAGISTDSGIPDFRGPQGLWTRNPEAEKMATLQHYVADPEVRRRAWRTRVESPMHDREPNDGHTALVALERRGILDTLITQNVDGLHLKAGSSPERVIEIHGTAREVVCLGCGERPPMERALARAGAAARRCDLMLAVGTKLSVYPIAGVVPVAKEAGARVVILNAEPTEMDSLADIVLRGSISALLPRLV